MRDLALGLIVEQQYDSVGSFCSLASSALVGGTQVDEDDLSRNEWKRQTADDYIAAVRAVLGYAIARGCKLGGSRLEKNYLEGEARRVS